MTTMINIRLKPELLSLLKSGRFVTFTAAELTDAYLELPSCKGLKRTSARQFVIRNLDRLEDRGLLQTLEKSGSKPLRYRLSDKFSTSDVTAGKPHRPMSQPIKINAELFAETLKDKLKKHKIELLSTIGEIEEYELIGIQSPQQHEHIQGLYNQAREHYSKTLGRIRALESLISQQ